MARHLQKCLRHLENSKGPKNVYKTSRKCIGTRKNVYKTSRNILKPIYKGKENVSSNASSRYASHLL
jgi:hypothetical protein